MITKRRPLKITNRRLDNNAAVRKNQHILDVKVRARTARRQRSRRMSGLVILLLLISCLGVAGYFGSTYLLNRFFFQNPAYSLTRIELDLDDSMDRKEFLEQTGIQEGRNIFSVNLARMESRLMADPRVSGVKIERILPDKLAVHVAQRKPVAWIATEGDTFSPESGYLVGADGMLMKAKTTKPEYLSLPVIKNMPKDNLHESEVPTLAGFRSALELIGKNTVMAETLLQIRIIDLAKDYRLDVVDDQKAHIYFALTDIDAQLKKLNTLLAHCQETHREIESVNLMIQRNTPVRFLMAESTSSKSSAAPARQNTKPTRIQ